MKANIRPPWACLHVCVPHPVLLVCADPPGGTFSFTCRRQAGQPWPSTGFTFFTEAVQHSICGSTVSRIYRSTTGVAQVNITRPVNPFVCADFLGANFGYSYNSGLSTPFSVQGSAGVACSSDVDQLSKYQFLVCWLSELTRQLCCAVHA